MTETTDDERDARMTLAALSEPGDIVTGTLVARFGAQPSSSKPGIAPARSTSPGKPTPWAGPSAPFPAR